MLNSRGYFLKITERKIKQNQGYFYNFYIYTHLTHTYTNTHRVGRHAHQSLFMELNLYYIRSFKIYLFIYLWLCWVFVSVRGLSLVVASGGHSSSRCAGLSLSHPLLLRSTGFRRAGSVIVAHGPSCSAACGIFPDQGSNPCPLHWQADSQPLRHQGSPIFEVLCLVILLFLCWYSPSSSSD